MKKKKFIVIWPMIFREFDYYRLELSELCKNFDVEIHELSNIFDSGLSKIYNPKTICKRKIVKRFSSLTYWIKNFFKISKKYQIVVMYNFHTNSFKKFTVRFILSLMNITIIRYSKENLPDYKINSKLFFYKFKKNLNFKIGFFYINNIFFNFISKSFSENYLLSMTSNNFQKEKKINKRSKIIKASSYDYSNALMYKPNKNDKRFDKLSYSILLDTPGPKNIGDEYVYRTKAVPINNWYKSINNFFSFLEKNFKLKCKIAPHPKTMPEKFSKEFDYRETVFNKLAYVAKKAKIIISKVPGSTAIIYAALYNKPLIFVYSDEYKKNKQAMQNLNLMTKELNTKPINIDKKYSIKILKKIMKIKKKIMIDI